MEETIQIGDYVTTQISPGFFRVEKIASINEIDPATKQKGSRVLFMLKKALSPKFEFSKVFVEIFNKSLCKKVDKLTEEKIKCYFEKNPKNLRRFEEIPSQLDMIKYRPITCDSDTIANLTKYFDKTKELTEEDIDLMPIIKNNKFSGFWGDVKKGDKIIDVRFINNDLKTNKQNWLIWKFHDCVEE